MDKSDKMQDRRSIRSINLKDLSDTKEFGQTETCVRRGEGKDGLGKNRKFLVGPVVRETVKNQKKIGEPCTIVTGEPEWYCEHLWIWGRGNCALILTEEVGWELA